jgi:hypothetical protein
MEIAEAGDSRRDLRKVARRLIDKASEGDVRAIEELANRLDGKVPQAIVGDDDEPAVRLKLIERRIVNTSDPDSEDLPPPAGPGEI